MARRRNFGGNRPGLEAIHINGDRLSTTNQKESNHNRVRRLNDHLHNRDLLSRLREPTMTEDAVWPEIKDILESMGDIMDVLKEVEIQKITPKPVFMLSAGYA